MQVNFNPDRKTTNDVVYALKGCSLGAIGVWYEKDNVWILCAYYNREPKIILHWG
jgi:hypothetical protein